MSELDQGSSRLSFLGLTFQHKEDLGFHTRASLLQSLVLWGMLHFVP